MGTSQPKTIILKHTKSSRFPYIDTLKILEKFGPGCLFYGSGSSEDLDDLELKLKSGARFLAFYCEFPGNPLLKSPDLARVRRLADLYDFAVVVDETIGNFLNVHVLPYADVVVSSLTKIFSGDSNVMGGRYVCTSCVVIVPRRLTSFSVVLNPKSRYYDLLWSTWSRCYEDNYWAEDALFMERNSRDFVSRITRINTNAEAICDALLSHPRGKARQTYHVPLCFHTLANELVVKQVNYPKSSPTRPFYDHCRTASGGYGGLLSATFYTREDAIIFFDNLDTAKGPSLGTNFTLR